MAIAKSYELRTRFAASSAVNRLSLLHQYFLRLSQARAELHRVAQALQDHLDPGDRGDDIERVRVSQVRDAEDLALKLVLAARAGYPVFHAQVLIDRLAVHACRGLDGRERIARTFLGEEPEPERRCRRAGRSREPIRALEHVLKPLILEHFDAGVQADDERHRGSEVRLVLGQVLTLF